MKKSYFSKRAKLHFRLFVLGVWLSCFLFVPQSQAYKMEKNNPVGVSSVEPNQTCIATWVKPNYVICPDLAMCYDGEICCFDRDAQETCFCCDATCSSCSCTEGLCYGCYNPGCAASYLYKEKDDEEILEPFRVYRDKILSKQPNGSALIAAYYKYSPVLINIFERNPTLKQRARVLADYFLKTLNTDSSEIRLTPQKAKELRIFILDLQKAVALEKTSSGLLKMFPNIKRELQNTKTIQSQN